jgi:predicted PurR-regulated permease PerM
MTEREKFCSKVLIGILFFYFVFLIKGILFPFIMGIIIAYLFNPLANKMEKRVPRFIASLVIITLFTLFIALLITFFTPIIFHQIISMLRELSLYFTKVDGVIYKKISDILGFFGISNGSDDMKLYFQQFNEDIIKFFGIMVNNLFASSIAFVGLLSFLFITPTTAYYFLKDWNKILKRILKYIPKNKEKRAKRLFKRIDYILSSYLKGQLIICLALGIFYALLLFLVGLNYSLFVGIIAGLLTIIPYFGVFLGGSLGMILAYLQWGVDFKQLLLVLGAFVLGQFIEGNFVTPKFMGHKIQLHPMWIIFALFVGGALGGFWGIVLALPTAAVLSVIIKFSIKEHRRIKRINEKNRQA